MAIVPTLLIRRCSSADSRSFAISPGLKRAR